MGSQIPVLLGAVAPAAPAVAELGALLVLFVALGLLLVAHVFLGALFRVTRGLVNLAVGWVPWLGKKAVGGLFAVEHRVNHALATAITGVEAGISDTWHRLAHLVQWLGHITAQTAQVAASLWWYVHVKFPLHVLHALVHRVTGIAHTIRRTLTIVTHKTVYVTKVITHPQAGPIAAGVKWGTRTIEAEFDSLNTWTRTKIAGLVAAVTVTLPAELGRLGGEVESLGHRIRSWGKTLKRHERLLAASAFAALLIHALAKLGAGWIRCGNVRTVGRRICGMNPNQLEDLLGLTVGIVGTLSIITLAKELQEITDAETRAIRFLIRETR